MLVNQAANFYFFCDTSLEKMEMDTSHSDSIDPGPEITLKVNGAEFKCRKELLINASDYFKGMFASNFRESSLDTIELKDSKPEVMKLLVSSLTEEPDITEDNVYELLEASVMYQFTEVLKMCCDFLKDTLCSSNCLGVMWAADMFSLTELFNMAKRHALYHFEEVAKEEEVTEMSEEQLVEYLTNNLLNCSDEVSIFDVICSWQKRNFGETYCENVIQNGCHKDSLDDVLTVSLKPLPDEDGNNNPGEESISPQTVFYNIFYKCVHLDVMTEKELKQLLKHPMVATNNSIRNLISNAMVTQKMIHKSKMIMTTGRREPLSVLCFGGHLCSQAPCENPEDCDVADKPREILWFSRMPREQCAFHMDSLSEAANQQWGDNALRMIGCQVTLVGKDVFVTGGEATLGRNTWQWRMTVYDCISKQWSCKNNLRTPRRHHAACAVDNKQLFLIGGFGRFRKILNTMESYDVKTEQWSDHPDMLQPEFSASVAICNNSIYVFKTQIQKYNLATRDWSMITIKQQISSSVNFALTYDGHIYLCCKFNKTLRLFNPKSKECKEIGHFEKECKGCVLYGGKIYWFEDYTHCPTVECYDPQDKSFSVVGKLKNCYLSGAILTAPKFPNFHPSALT